MKIAIFTQSVPFYLPELLISFFQSNTRIDFEVYCFKSYQRSIWHEARKRYEYYGARDFIKLILLFLKKKVLSALKFRPCSIKSICRCMGIPYEEAGEISSAEFVEIICKKQYDLIISLACPQIINRQILELPRIGCLNYHTALLPRNRGRQPLFWAMLNDEKEAAVTIHWMDEKIDNGPFLCQKRFSLEGIYSLDKAYKRSIAVGSDALNEAVKLIENNNFVKIPNDISKATYNKFPDKKSSARFRAKGYRFF